MNLAIRHKRQIIDRQKIIKDLQGQSLEQARDILKLALNDGKSEIKDRFMEGGLGRQTVHETAFLIDQIIKLAYDYLSGSLVKADTYSLAVIAMGGYGRSELCPYSDIDLCFITPRKANPHQDQFVKEILYLLWDLGLKVGHATRSITQMVDDAKGDMILLTSLLDMRALWGSQSLYLKLKSQLSSQVFNKLSAQSFINTKTSERDYRLKKMGDVRYVLEPNIKEGKGGLRDLHTLYWIAKFRFKINEMSELVALNILSPTTYNHYQRAYNFLLTLRCHLHYLADRAEERLSYDLQPALAVGMHYLDRPLSQGVERLMKHYFINAKEIGNLTRLFHASLVQIDRPNHSLISFFKSKSHINGFMIVDNQLSPHSSDQFNDQPLDILRLFETSLESGLELSPASFDLIAKSLRKIDKNFRQNPLANQIFLKIIMHSARSEAILRIMSETGVLARFIPAFGRIMAQMQYNLYHAYTTDEHTIQAIGILHKLGQDPVIQKIINTINSKKTLFIALFFHDIGKGRVEDHSEAGMRIAMKLCPQLGFSYAETEMVVWLVKYHLLLSSTAFRRDLDNQKTIDDFVKLVQSPERLRLLYVLTIADIKAVGPNVWNEWKGRLLEELYKRSLAVMMGDSGSGRNLLDNELKKLGWNHQKIQNLVNLLPRNYGMSLPLATQLHHALMLKDIKNEEDIIISSDNLPSANVTELCLYAPDQIGLFSRFAGAIATLGINIVDARIITLNNKMALDSFWVQDLNANAITEPDIVNRLKLTVKQILNHPEDLQDKLSHQRPLFNKRYEVFKIPPRVIIDNYASNSHTVIEINGKDRPALLYELTTVLTQMNLQITSAHISTYGERVVDVFYIKDMFGFRIYHPKRLGEIEARLLDVIGRG